MKTICLVMIVKNEMGVLKRCFDSVHKYIDTWFICDTGSTDGTKEFIRNYFKDKGIPGTLQEDEWVDFGTNRSRAVKGGYNKADYLLLMDADFIFCLKDPNFKKSNLDLDGYQIKYEGGLDYRQLLFVSGRKKWRYIGVTHEYIHCDGVKKISNLDSFTFNHKCDGGNRNDKFERDVRLLKKGLEDEPDNSRYMFYLAQSLKDLGKYDEAVIYYEKRVEKENWPEEVYYSLYQIGLCKLKSGKSFEEYSDALLKAYEYRPSRLEALHYLVNSCRLTNRFDMGYKYGINAINTAYPHNDVLFIEKYIHKWAFFDELALCSHYIGKNKTAIQIYKRLMDNNLLPPNQIERFEKNMEFFKRAYEIQIREDFDKSMNATRIGFIIVNSNDKENTNKLVEYVSNNCNTDFDIVVIDNGCEENQCTNSTLRLNNDINITAAWKIGLDYLDILRSTHKKEYFAYCFTSSKVDVSKSVGSLTKSIYDSMKNDIRLVGGHPSLSDDSNKTFNYMKCNKDGGMEKIRNIDNIFSIYRASWFDQIGRFSLDLLYTRGIGIELAYIANTGNKYLVLDNDIQIQYTEKHKNETNKEHIVEYFREKYGHDYKQSVYANLGQRIPIGESNPTSKKNPTSNIVRKLEKNMTVFIIYYGFHLHTGDIYISIRNYAEYLSKHGDKVVIVERMPTNEELENFKPDCIISAGPANSDVRRYIDIWNIPWVILTFGRNQYPVDELSKYPSLVTYSNSHIKSYDSKQKNGVIVRDPINHEQYRVPETNRDPTYITLIGDPPNVKGHSIFLEMAKRFPNEQFMLVTKETYDDIPSNVTLQGYIKDIEELKSKVYSKIKILLLPSAIEAFGRVVIEATASKIPCILSDFPGLSEATFGMSNYVPFQSISLNDGIVEYNVDSWETEIRRVLNDYDNEVEKSGNILEKLNYERDVSHFRNLVLDIVNNK